MRILFWSFISFDQHSTSEHLLKAVLARLCEAGHSVHILQKKTGGDLPLIPEELKGCPVMTDALPFQAADKENFLARYLAELKYIKACRKNITSAYDAVFIQSTTVGGFAVRAIRKKLPHAIVTFNVQDIFPYNAAYSGKLKADGLVFKVLAGIQRYGYRHADHVITISEDMKEQLVRAGAREETVQVVYNWSYRDEPYGNVDLTPVSTLFSRDHFNVVYAGNIGVMQNVDILVEAARLMKNDGHVWFHIIGNGVYKEKLKARAAEYGIGNISFWPMQPPEMAPLIYSAADVNIIPLVKGVYRTALPSKTATCMACGKPIIFAIGRESKFGQLVEKETGCKVIDSDDPQQLAEAIRSVPDGSDSRAVKAFFAQHMGITKNSREYAKTITER